MKYFIVTLSRYELVTNVVRIILYVFTFVVSLLLNITNSKKVRNDDICTCKE